MEVIIVVIIFAVLIIFGTMLIWKSPYKKKITDIMGVILAVLVIPLSMIYLLDKTGGSNGDGEENVLNLPFE